MHFLSVPQEQHEGLTSQQNLMKLLKNLPSFPLCVGSHKEQTTAHQVLKCIDEALLTSTGEIYQDQDNSGLRQMQGQVNPGSVDKVMECLLSGRMSIYSEKRLLVIIKPIAEKNKNSLLADLLQT